MAQTEEKVRETFKSLDTSGDGTLTVQEFHGLFKTLGGASWDDKKINRLFKAADVDRSGSVDVDEFLSWVFAEKTVKAAVEDTDSSDDSSTSSDDDEAKAKIEKAAKKKKKQKKALLINEETLYQILVYTDGRVQPRLQLGDLGSMFAKCARSGFGTEVARLVPQGVDVGPGQEPEDLSASDLACLAALLKDKPDASLEDAQEALAVARGRMSSADSMTVELQDAGYDPEMPIGFGQFKKLAALASAVMLVDPNQFYVQVFWAKTDVFELTEAMACQVMMRIFLRAESKKSPLMKQKVQGNDFMRMCHVQKLSDNSGKVGIPHAKLSLFFADVLKRLPQLLEVRKARKKPGGKAKKKKKEGKTYASIAGRMQISVLFDELFKAMPPGTYRGPLDLVLTLLQKAESM